jgi:hypothetical protein
MKVPLSISRLIAAAARTLPASQRRLEIRFDKFLFQRFFQHDRRAAMTEPTIARKIRMSKRAFVNERKMPLLA